MIDGVVYDDIGAALAAEGPQVLLDHIRNAIRDIGPQIIVIDSFKAIHDLAGSTAEMRRLVSELAGHSHRVRRDHGVPGRRVQRGPDPGVRGVRGRGRHHRVRAPQHREARRALPARAQAARQPLRRGLPRVHARERRHARVPAAGRRRSSRPTYRTIRERVTTGVPGLDKMLDGGIWRGSSTLVEGTGRIRQDDDRAPVRDRGRTRGRDRRCTSTSRRIPASSGGPSRRSAATSRSCRSRG